MLVSGEWYIVITCSNCNSKVKLFRDLNNGTSNHKGSYVVTCPKCKHQGSYDGERYQHRERRKRDILIDIV